jgi:hypothetical protein
LDVLKAKEQDTLIRGSIRFPLEQQHSALSPKMPTRKRNSQSYTPQNALPDAPCVDELYSSSLEASMEGQSDDQVHQEPCPGLMDATNVGNVARDTELVQLSPLSPKMPVRQRTGGNSRSDRAESTIGEYPTMADMCESQLNGSLDRFNLSVSQLVQGSNIEPASPVLPKMPVRQRTVGVSEHLAATEAATTVSRSEQLSLSSLSPKPEVFLGSSSRFDLSWGTSMSIEPPSPLLPQVPVRRQSVEVAPHMSNATPGGQLLGSSSYSRMSVHEEEDPHEEFYGSSARLDLRDNIDPSSSALPALPIRYDSLETRDSVQSSADSSLKDPSVASLKAAQDEAISGRPFANLEASTNVRGLSTDGSSNIRHGFSRERKLGTPPRAPPFGQTTLSASGIDGSASPMVRHSSHSTGFGYSAGQKMSPLGTASRHSTGGALPLPSTSRKAGVSNPHHGRDQQLFTESPTPGTDDGDARFFTSPTSVRDMVWARAEEAKQRRFNALIEGSKQESHL